MIPIKIDMKKKYVVVPTDVSASVPKDDRINVIFAESLSIFKNTQKHVFTLVQRFLMNLLWITWGTVDTGSLAQKKGDQVYGLCV